MKFKVGLYGAAVNVLVVAGMLIFSKSARAGTVVGDYVLPLLMLAVSAFIVYYFVVSSYVAKRKGIQKPVFFDSLIGMLAELIIVTFGAVCYSLWTALSNMHGQDIGVLATDVTNSILLNLLWVFAMFMVHILIAGNIAGLAGWYLLQKIDPKSLS